MGEIFNLLKMPMERTIDRRIMLFDLSIGGHHPNYIQQLVHYWNDNKVPGKLEVVVSPRFLEAHGDVVDLSTHLERSDIRFTAITAQEEAELGSRKTFISRTKRSFQEWELLCKYASLVKATQCLIMYFDTAQIPLAIGISSPCPFSGIYFRPTFHYSKFSNYRLSWKEQLQQRREKFILSRVLRHSQFHRLFCLDPFAVKYLQNYEGQVIYLPDPVSTKPEFSIQPEVLKGQLGIEPNRRVFLLFGALTGRKGIHKLLDAISMLPPNLSQCCCLLLVGEIKSTDQPIVEAKIASIRQSLPVQIITHYQFVPDAEIQSYFHLSDVVLAPYQRHVGMSGILLLAAAAQKPVLSSDYGLMGELVRSYDLGLPVDTMAPSEITGGLVRFLTELPETFGDRQSMRQFAEQNATEHYARVIFENL